MSSKPINVHLAFFARFAKSGWFRKFETTAVLLQIVAVIALLLAFTPYALTAQDRPSSQSGGFIVVIDAAHGGPDRGAKIGDGSEKDITLALSVKLRSLLMARGMTVITTRESDTDLDADRRAEIANRASAQACLDLHAAEARGGSSSEVHLFLSSLPAAKRGEMTPWRTAQSASIPRSMELAGTLNSALTQAGITVTLGRAPLATVDSMNCPAVAVEIALEGSQDSDDSGFESKVLDALAAALVEWRADGAQLGEVRRP